MRAKIADMTLQLMAPTLLRGSLSHGALRPPSLNIGRCECIPTPSVRNDQIEAP